MISIRDSFIASVEETACDAVGVHVVIIEGISAYRAMYESTPDEQIELAAYEDRSRIIRYSPTHENVLSTLNTNPFLAIEAFHGIVIQLWHEFLSDLYCAGVAQELATPGMYQLGEIELRIDAEALSGAALPEQLANAARVRFDFAVKSNEKLRVVAKMLKRTEAIRQPAIQAHVDKIRQNVVVRNVLQHNRGILRSTDLDELGVKELPSDLGSKIHYVPAGFRVHRTPFDLDDCVASMVALARELVV
jgi:hypothetical protein